MKNIYFMYCYGDIKTHVI